MAPLLTCFLAGFDMSCCGSTAACSSFIQAVVMVVKQHKAQGGVGG
jgi:hypothetical protein